MERCPCCKAKLRGQTLCSRCRTDLSRAIDAEHAADIFLIEALRLWQEHRPELCLHALEQSLQLKHTSLGEKLYHFFIDQQCQEVLKILAKNQPLLAKQRLYALRPFFSKNQILSQMNAFADYQLTKCLDEQEHY